MNLLRLFNRTTPSVEIVKNEQGAKALALALSNGTYKPSAKIAAALERVDKRMSLMTDARPNTGVTFAEHYRAASSRDWKAALLSNLVRFQRAKSILEVGTAYGASGIALALSQDVPKLVTIEISPNQREVGQSNLLAEVPNAECIFEDEATALPRLAAERRFDFVFHDAAHRGDNYLRAFDVLLPALEPGAMFVIDDIQWDDRPANRAKTTVSPITCREGWEQIVARPEVKGAVLVKGRIGVLLI